MASSIFNKLKERISANEKAALASTTGSMTEQAAAVGQAKTGKAGGALQKISSLAEEAEQLKARGMIQSEASNLNAVANEVGAKEAQASAALEQAASAQAQETAGKLEGVRLDTQLQREDADSKKDRFLSQLLSDEELTTQKIQSTMQQSVQKMLSDKKINEDQIFSQYKQDNKELAFRRDAAELEQLGTTLALRDKDYMREINAIGQERDLQDDISFQREANRLVFGNKLNTLVEQIGWSEADASDERAFVEKLAQMDIDQAIAIADYAARSESIKSLISGATTIGTAGATKYFADEPKETPKPTGASLVGKMPQPNSDKSTIERK